MTTSEDFLKKYANLLDPKAQACQTEASSPEANACTGDDCTVEACSCCSTESSCDASKITH